MHGLPTWRTWIVPAMVAAIVAAAVTTNPDSGWESQARAEPRRVTPQDPEQHFKSGGRLSEAVLQEMLVVLKRIDERLSRLERSVEQLPTGGRDTNHRSDTDARPAGESAPIQVRRNPR